LNYLWADSKTWKDLFNIHFLIKLNDTYIWIIIFSLSLSYSWIYISTKWRKKLLFIQDCRRLHYWDLTLCKTEFPHRINIILTYYCLYLSLFLHFYQLFLLLQHFISYRNVNTGVHNSKCFAYLSSTVFWFIFNFPILIEVNIKEINRSSFVCIYESSKSYHDFAYHLIFLSVY
jgi:hypothetical protein